MARPNDTAFPGAEPQWFDEQKIHEEWHPGLTKREYFAALALQGYIAAYTGENVFMPEPELAAERSVAYADALIKALREGQADD